MHTSSVGVAVACAALAAFTDHRTGLIPNRLTLGTLALAFVLHGTNAALAGSASDVACALASTGGSALLAGIAPAILFTRGGLGGGDVKLLAAIGALLGPLGGLHAELASFAIGGAYALVRLAVRRNVVAALRSAFGRGAPGQTFGTFRLGPAIFAGTLLVALLDRLA
jgi:prepilin peptidase CpaA